jgi:hypothetical protein
MEDNKQTVETVTTEPEVETTVAEKTFTQSEFDEALKKAVSRKTKDMPSKEELDKFKEWQDQQKTESDKLVEKEKGLVMNNAMKAHGADVLVAPLVDIQTDLKNQLVITVTAYPAKYKNYRNATKEDEWFINVPMVEIK